MEVAERLGLPCILIYDGEYTIRTSIERARLLAAELQASSRKGGHHGRAGPGRAGRHHHHR